MRLHIWSVLISAWHIATAINDIRAGIELCDIRTQACEDKGIPQFTPWISDNGGGSSLWASDSNFYDPDGVIICLQRRDIGGVSTDSKLILENQLIFNYAFKQQIMQLMNMVIHSFKVKSNTHRGQAKMEDGQNSLEMIIIMILMH